MIELTSLRTCISCKCSDGGLFLHNKRLRNTGSNDKIYITGCKNKPAGRLMHLKNMYGTGGIRMKKRLCILMGMLALSFSLVTGCGSREASEEPAAENEAENTENQPETEPTDGEEESPAGEDGTDNGESQPETRSVNVYYVDDQTAEVTSKSVEIADENDIWAALQESGILTDDCQLLSLNVNEQDGTMELDFNKATGDRVRSMGTTGETEIVGCIVNTYLEAYNCEGILLTEEGGTFESSHASYDGYSSAFTF